MHACMHACIHTYIHTYIYIYIYRWRSLSRRHWSLSIAFRICPSITRFSSRGKRSMNLGTLNPKP